MTGGVLLERDGELTQLHRLLGELEASGGRVVLVRGEGGIGKTALVSRFATEAEDVAHVLVGVCDDLLTPQPLGPVRDFARHDPSLSAALAAGDRRTVMEALLDLLSRRLRPTVLVLEDMQWADGATLDVIRFLGRRIERSSGLLVLTYRDGEVDDDHPLRLVIGNLPPRNLVRMSLAPLSVEAIREMAAGVDLDADRVAELTGGNPLFVTQVLAQVGEQVPASLRDWVLAGVAQLSQGARRILDLVSVIPGGAPITLVERIGGPASEEQAECEQRGLLQRGGEMVSFRHEIVRRAVESALSASDRRELNGLVLAEVAEDDPAVVVHHAREAGDAEAIVRYAPRAARAAMAVGSHREALAHFHALEPYLDRIAPVERAGLLEDRARAELLLEKVEGVDTIGRAIDIYRSARSSRALAKALTFAVRLYEISGRPEAAEACAVEAVAILESPEPTPELAHALSQRALLLMLRGDGQALEFADRAISVAEAVGAERAVIEALIVKGSHVCAGGDRAGYRILEECVVRAEEHGYVFEEVRALSNMADSAVQRLELERAGDWAVRARDTAARHEMPHIEVFAQVLLAALLVMSGDWAAAVDALTEVPESLPNVEAAVSCALGRVQARLGRAEASATLDRAWSLATLSGETQYLAPAAAVCAEHLWLTGSDDGSLVGPFLEILDAAVRQGEPLSAGDLAFWLWELGHLRAVPDRIAEPYRLVMSGRPTEAAAIWKDAGVPYEQAMALMHGSEADRLRALQILEELGAAAADRLRRSLRDQGVRVPRVRAVTTHRHPAGLTARQAEVLALLAEGLTNRQIADRLFVSRRTAENHVAAILQKLDAADRHAAVVAARDQGVRFV